MLDRGNNSDKDLTMMYCFARIQGCKKWEQGQRELKYGGHND